MNTKNILGHKALAQQVRAVIDRLDRAGSASFNARAAKPDFRTVTITRRRRGSHSKMGDKRKRHAYH